MGTFPITIPNTFATASSPIPLNKLDSDFTTVVTAINGISSGTYPIASPAIQGGTMSGTITLSGTISGSAGAVNPGTISTSNSITAGTTVTASGSITSGNGDVVATTGKVVAGDVNNYLSYNGSNHGYSTWQVSSDSSTYYDRTEKTFYFNPNGTNGVFKVNSGRCDFTVSDGVYINGTKISAGGNGVTQIIAGTNVTISPVGGTGAVTINASGGGGGGNVTGGNGISVAGSTVSMSGSYTGDFTATGKVIAGGSYPLLEYTSGYSNLNFSSAAGFSFNGSGQIDMSVGGTSQLHFNSSEFVCNPTPKANQVAWSLISDAREKTNVSALSLSTQRIMQLKPVAFTWIKDGKEDSGFIAQEFETVYPENVQEIDDRKHIGLNMNVIADMVATIQELRTELDALKAKVGA